MDFFNNCWICEGWNEVSFVWDNSRSFYNFVNLFLIGFSEKLDYDEIAKPIFIHFEHENWKPIMLERKEIVKKI